MCLSLIDNLDPERTIVTVFPVSTTRMRITYSMNTLTNDLGHFLMCIPFKIPQDARVEVNSIENVKALFQSLKAPETIIGVGLIYRCTGQSCVQHFISGPFEVFFIRDISDLDKVRGAMQECNISQSRQELMIKQMEFLNCGFVLAKYMPIENLLYDFVTKSETLSSLPVETLYTLTRRIQTSKLNLQELTFLRIVQDKFKELKSEYKPHHKMINVLSLQSHTNK